MMWLDLAILFPCVLLVVPAILVIVFLRDLCRLPSGLDPLELEKRRFVELDRHYDIEIRLALLENYTSHQRHWNTGLLALAGTLIALAQVAKEIGPSLTTIVVVNLAAQVLYALIRISWYGKRSQCIYSVKPVEGTEPYLLRLDVGVTKGCYENYPLSYSYLDKMRGIKHWAEWSFVFLLLSMLLGSYVDIRSILEGIRNQLPLLTFYLAALALVVYFLWTEFEKQWLSKKRSPKIRESAT